MTQSHIYIYGDIWNDQGDYASDYGIVSLKYVVGQLQASASAEELIVHIHSRGGDVTEGFAIHDALVNSGKKITTVNDGLCASIATVVFLSGSVRKMNANAEFMIHNPWGYGPYEGGDAADFANYAEDLKKCEDKLINLYAVKTGKSADELREMMNYQTYMDADQAKTFGFVTEVIAELKAVAYLKHDSKNTINKKTAMANKVIEKVNGLLADIKGFFSENVALNLDLTTADGKAFHVETEEDMPKVGDMCTIDGVAPADGDYTLSDGTVVAVSAGKITAVTPKVEDSSEAPAVDAAAITAMKKENEELKAQLKERDDALENAATQLEDFKNKVKSTHKPDKRETPPKDAGKKAEAADPFKEARQRQIERNAKKQS